MLRQAPSLEAAEAFLAAARARSFRAAAAELALSPSAFSRRIQMLEAFVEAPLFDRSGPAVRLTEVGARYLSQIEPAMETIRRATADLKDAAGRLGRLRLATSHSLAVGWLIPRLPDLLQRHGLEVDLTVGRGPQVLRSGAADIALWGGDGGEDDLACDRIVDLDGVLVSAPTLADGRAPPRRRCAPCGPARKGRRGRMHGQPRVLFGVGGLAQHLPRPWRARAGERTSARASG